MPPVTSTREWESASAPSVRSSAVPARTTSNQAEKASTRSKSGGQPGDGAMDGAHGQLVLGQLDDEGQDQVVRSGLSPLAARHSA